MKKYYRSVDLLLASVHAARQGKHTLAGKLINTALSDPGLDDAMSELDDMQEEARTRAVASLEKNRRRIVARQRRVAKATEGDESDSLESLLDDVSEAAEDDTVSDDELDSLVIEEGSDDEGSDDEGSDDEDDEGGDAGEDDEGEPEEVAATVKKRKTAVSRTARNLSAVARLAEALKKQVKV